MKDLILVEWKVSYWVEKMVLKMAVDSVVP